MTYWEETIPADANPGPLVHAALAAKLTALGWSLEDTVVIGARTHKIYKSAAAGNTYGLDWYLDISYPTTGVASGLMLCPFEGYTAASDVATRGPYSQSNTTLDGTTYSRFGSTTQALETQWTNSTTYVGLDTPLSTSAFVINADVTRNRVILLSSTEPTQVGYTGFYTPTAEHAAHAGAALFPLIMCRLSGMADRTSSTTAGSVTAALTRVPKLSAMSNWGNHAIVGPAMHRATGRVGGAASETDAQITTVPYLVGTGASWGSVSTMVMGELDGVQCGWADPGVTRGDFATIGGVAYCLSTITSSSCVLIAQV